MSRVLQHLEKLVGFTSLSDTPNGEIVDYIEAVLNAAGARVHRVFDDSGAKSGVFAALGPGGAGGVMLSGHVDVVPVTGQDWSSDPFELRRDGSRVYGRGTTDMKGFLACMLTAAERAGDLAQPLKLAFSWDEEIGCRGIPGMLEVLEETIGMPDMCIVGEPTNMQIATGHKGKTALRALCHGQAGHSADAPDYVNALQLGAAFVTGMARMQDQIASEGTRDPGYGTPYSTLHAGIMQGGAALNIVPDHAEILFEIRNLAADRPEEIIGRLRQMADAIGGVDVEVTGGYPGLDMDPESAVVKTVQGMLPEARLTKVSYGTEAGHFAQAGVPTVVCGPGDMDQGHKPDEFIKVAQLEACEAFLDRLLRRLGES